MKLTKSRLKEIEAILIEAKPYFKKDLVSQEMDINLNSNEIALDKAKLLITSHLHPNVLKNRTDISEQDKKRKVQFLNEVLIAIEELKLHKREIQKEAEQEKLQEILNTIQECFNSDKITISTNKKNNYFTLFGFKQSKSSESILKSDRFQKLKNALRLEYSSLLPERYQSQFSYLIKCFKEFQKVLYNPNVRKQYEETLEIQPVESNQRIKNTINNILINYKNIRRFDRINYFTLFSISNKLTNAEIKQLRIFIDIKNAFVPENITLVDVKDRFMFNEIIDHFNTFSQKILSSEIERTSYENSLKINNLNDAQNYILNDMILYCENLPKDKLVNYYELFDIDPNMPSEEIKKTRIYKFLKENLSQKGVSRIDPNKIGIFQILIKHFNEFSTKVIENPNGREYYDKLLKQQEVNNNQNKSTTDEILELITAYKNAFESNDYIDYYELFEIPTGLSNKETLACERVVKLSNMLQEEKFNIYRLDESLKTIYINLCITFNTFKTWTLSSVERKAEYDMNISIYKEAKAKQKKKNN